MPKINSIFIKDNESLTSSRSLNYMRIDNLSEEVENNDKIINFIKDGGVLLSKLPNNFDQLDISFIKDLNHAMKEEKAIHDSCVWKGDLAKKLYLDRINLNDLSNKNKKIINKLISAKEVLKEIGSKICSNHEIIRIEDIVYPSETIGRELHLDRHDKTKNNQNYRTIKMFLNLSPSSCRIWGIGPSRKQLLDKLGNYCRIHNLEEPKYEHFLKKEYELPKWLTHYNKDKRLNHPVSILNSCLNNMFLKKDDENGNFDLVYYDPIYMIIGDSKQVAHKPVYGTLGISIDILYDSVDIPHKDLKLKSFTKVNTQKNQNEKKEIIQNQAREKELNEKKLISSSKKIIKTNLKNAKRLIKKFLK